MLKNRFSVHVLVALSVLSLSSCSEAIDYSVPANEEYTREFIKEFGLIDGAQDWNMATSADVKINVGDYAHSLKIYAKVGDTYYLTASLIKVEGEVSVPIDIPESTTDLMVKVDGRRYFAKVGEMVDASSRALSRGVSDQTGKNATFTLDGHDFSVTVTASEATGDAQYFKFNAQQMGPILASSTNRKYDGTQISTDAYRWPDYYSVTSNSWVVNDASNINIGRVPEKEGNVNRNGVYQDFSVTLEGTELTMYPMYWYTSNSHHVCVYLIDANGNPVRDSDKEIITFPVYQAKAENDIQYYNKNLISHSAGVLSTLYSLPEELADAWSEMWNEDGELIESKKQEFEGAVVAYYVAHPEDRYCNTCGRSYPAGKIEVSGINILSWAGKNNVGLELNGQHVDYKDDVTGGYTLPSASTSGKPDVLDETGGVWVDCRYHDIEDASIYNSGNFSNSNGSYAFKAPGLMRSQGIHIQISGWTGPIGLCTVIGDNTTLYSQSMVNQAKGVTANGFTPGTEIKEEDRDKYMYSYAASYFHPVTKSLFYSFEDWIGGDHDLNDLVFMIDGVDHLDTDKGEVPVKETTVNETEQVLSWILAAEDLGAIGDFDFNDVVLKISTITTNVSEDENVWSDIDKTELISGSSIVVETHKQVRVQALAAGGTLPVYIHYYDADSGVDYLLGPDNKVVINDDSDNHADCEWHRWFGDYACSTMINTGSVSVAKPKYCVIGYSNKDKDGQEEKSWQIPSFENFSMATYGKSLTDGRLEGFYITVNTSVSGSGMGNIGHARILSAPAVGNAPQMFLIPDTGYGEGAWAWPTERTSILDAYSGFGAWVSDAGSNDWHKSAPSGSVTRPVSL